MKHVEEEDKSLWNSFMSGGNPFGGLVGALLGTFVLRMFKSIKLSFLFADLIGIIGSIVITL